MRTLEQVLIARGYTQEELKTLPLNDTKFRAAMEAEIVESDRRADEAAKAKEDLNKYDKWFTDELTPEHEKALKDAEDARAEAAASNARLKAIQERTTRRQAENQDPEAMAEADRLAKEAADKERSKNKEPKYVSSEEFQGAFKATGQGIANGVDLALDHQELFGKRINLTDLWAEAEQAKMPVRKYWEQKYKVSDRRSELAAKAERDKEETIRKDERSKVVAEFGTGSNPNLQTLRSSNNPFYTRNKSGNQNNKQPWEVSENERERNRLNKAVEKAAARGDI